MVYRLPDHLNTQVFPPKRGSKKVYKTVRPGPGQQIYGLCINQEITGHDTHWSGDECGKQLCLPPCPRCELWQRTGDRHHAPRWYGWMPVLWFSTGWTVCFEITAEAARECPQLSDKRIPLRGKILRLTRAGRGKFGRVVATVEDFPREVAIPAVVDMAEWLSMAFELEPHPFHGVPDGKSRGAGE